MDYRLSIEARILPNYEVEKTVLVELAGKAADSMPYPHHDWTRPLYFAVLIPHIILAAVMMPFIIVAVIHALKGRFEKHRRITRWLWWVWMYVSLSGITVYLMLYHL